MEHAIDPVDQAASEAAASGEVAVVDVAVAAAASEGSPEQLPLVGCMPVAEHTGWQQLGIARHVVVAAFAVEPRESPWVGRA